MSLPVGLHGMWPTPIGVHRFDGASDLNPLLVRVFAALRLDQEQRRGAAPGPFFASDDDLLQRVQLPEWQGFVRFLVESLRATVSGANAQAWPAAKMELAVRIEGSWFQVGNRGVAHDVHSHGNCSWSGVYCVQVDPDARRVRHPSYGDANGSTRFYGPYQALLRGAWIDRGNAYLQAPHLDVAPEPGRLLVFPSWLEHQALPYEGELDRVVVSFNASVHAAQGSDRLHAYAQR